MAASGRVPETGARLGSPHTASRHQLRRLHLRRSGARLRRRTPPTRSQDPVCGSRLRRVTQRARGTARGPRVEEEGDGDGPGPGGPWGLRTRGPPLSTAPPRSRPQSSPQTGTDAPSQRRPGPSARPDVAASSVRRWPSRSSLPPVLPWEVPEPRIPRSGPWPPVPVPGGPESLPDRKPCFHCAPRTAVNLTPSPARWAPDPVEGRPQHAQHCLVQAALETCPRGHLALSPASTPGPLLLRA